MKRIALFLKLALLMGILSAFAQDAEELRQRQLAEIQAFKQSQLRDMQSFRDSINRQFAQFLEENWQQMETKRREVGFKPFQPVEESPRIPNPVQRVEVPSPPSTPNVNQTGPNPPSHVTVPRIDRNPNARNAKFFGADIPLALPKLNVGLLRGCDSRSVAEYWRKLSAAGADCVSEELARIQSEIAADDWGLYQLAYELAPYYIDDAGDNERVIFTVYVLSQQGFRCKMAESAGCLYPMISCNSTIKNASYITFPPQTEAFYIISKQNINNVTVCRADFPGGNKLFNINPPVTLPRIGGDRQLYTRNWNGKNYSIRFDPEIVRFLDSYPCIDFVNYVHGPVDPEAYGEIKNRLASETEGLNVRAKLNYLLDFVQHGFQYRTDADNYGYEKWNFPDATLVADYCDCEDRAFLWTRLVKDITGINTALIYYPGIHMAAAAEVECNPGDDVISYRGRTYVLCDPTYMNSTAGMEAPSLRSNRKEVYPIAY